MIEKVIDAFCDSKDFEPLEGGQGDSIKAGNLVLKPADNESYTITIAKIWNSLNPSGYKIAKHVLSKKGNFIEMGYSATEYLNIHEKPLALNEKLAVSKSFHKNLKELNVKTLPFSDDPWTNANKILWKNERAEDYVSEQSLDFVKNILASLSKIDDEYQLIHADLSGNILFDENNFPVVIDFSPTIVPVKFADSIIVADSIAWQNAPLSSLKLLEPIHEYKKYVKYAIAFRIITASCREDKTFQDVMTEWKAYEPIWDFVDDLI